MEIMGFSYSNVQILNTYAVYMYGVFIEQCVGYNT